MVLLILMEIIQVVRLILDNKSNKQKWYKNVEMMIPLKYLSDFLRTIKNPLISCGINLELKGSINCVKVETNVAAQVKTFSITDTKLDAAVVTLSTQSNAKFLEQSKSGLKRIINLNKFQSKITRKTKSIFRLLN